MKTLDLLSKLMANENITVIRAKVRTASFDIVNRTLRLPIMLNLSDAEETMMAFHEVGHALFSDQNYLDFIEKESKKNFNMYMNVLEDVRIERLMKDRYPGARKDFFEGYRQLNERDFFGVSQSNVAALNLIDRINLFFKVGYRSGVAFNKEERQFIIDAEKTQTVSDVYDLAKKVYAYAVKQEEEKKLTQELNKPEDEEKTDEEDQFSDEFDFSEDYEESDEYSEDSEKETTDVKSNCGSGGEEHEQGVAPTSETQERFDRKVTEYTDDNSNFAIVVPGIRGRVLEVNYTTVISDFEQYFESYNPEYTQSCQNKYQNFRKESNKAVAHLFKEFEMRKAASRYSRTQVSTSGQVASSKLQKYLTSGDIFKKLEVAYDEKNHSFVMLLDWSGSMTDNLKDSIAQVITLSSFCRRANIPFVVYAFRQNNSWNFNQTDITVAKGDAGLATSGNINMIKFFHSSMTNLQFEKMSMYLYAFPVTRISNYDLTGTPLNEAICWIYNNLPDILKKNKTEKVTFITVTDGMANDSYIFNYDDNIIYSRHNTKLFIRCKYTGKLYPYSHDANENMKTLLLIMSKAFPTMSMIGFYIMDRSSRNLYEFSSVYGNTKSVSDIRHDVRKFGFTEYPTSIYDKLFVIPGSPDITEMKIEVEKDMTASQISRKFSKEMSRMVNSRVVLTKFVEMIA